MRYGRYRYACQRNTEGLLHRRYTDVQKMKVAEYARHHGVRPAEKKFGIHRRNIARWLEIRLDKVKERKRRKKSNRPGQGRKLTYPEEIDDRLRQWLLEARDLQVAVSCEMLKQKARLSIRPVQPDFKCSNGWVEKFFRYIIAARNRNSIKNLLCCTDITTLCYVHVRPWHRGSLVI